MMSEIGEKLPKDMAMAVKDYLLDKNREYKEAIKNTGPIDNASLYQSSSQSRETPTMFCRDDPYWSDFLQKNYRRQHLWKVPSILAWEHKPYGIIGEVIDFKRIDDNAKRAEKIIYF